MLAAKMREVLEPPMGEKRRAVILKLVPRNTAVKSPGCVEEKFESFFLWIANSPKDGYYRALKTAYEIKATASEQPIYGEMALVLAMTQKPVSDRGLAEKYHSVHAKIEAIVANLFGKSSELSQNWFNCVYALAIFLEDQELLHYGFCE
ncbi:MAG TPA: hypothetical protein VF817_04385 [Patescibacteria group bacterium]